MASSPKLLKGALVLIIVIAFYGEVKMILQSGNCLETNSVMDKPAPTWKSPPSFVVVEPNSIAPGELPGYTGWARPEKTLARYFSIASISNDEAATTATGYEFGIVVECRGHHDCVVVEPNSKNWQGNFRNSNDKRNDSEMCPSWFFLRAYGPSVVPGTITSRYVAKGESNAPSCRYEFNFVFFDPGVYTIEAVLTVSRPPPMSTFPLTEENEPHYEGYLLPGFPVTTTVAFVDGGNSNMAPAEDKALCQFEDLVETSATSAKNKARWKVTGRVNGRDYVSKTMNSTLVSTRGYATNINSLGINMEYRYVNDCLLIEESILDRTRRDKPALPSDRCRGSQQKVHIVYIGDSVLRVQKDMLQQFLKGVPKSNVELSYLSLHGGYRKNQAMGPANVQTFLNDLQTRAKNDNVVLLFNTGLHDIHRLCGDEFRDERPSYLDKNQLESGSFACLEEYRALLKDFLQLVQDFPASLKVFQSTTAAWPKYGNYGIGWGQNGQGMVLISDFCQAFNEIAFEVLHNYQKDIAIMDGYWITYPRPDNREVGDIGKKLSHPGVEVLSAMTRKFVMLILDRVCLPI